MITKLGSKTYLDEVTYQYDKFVKAILNATKDFSHSLSLDKENILSANIIDKLYFNMDNFDFYGLFSKEIPARSTLMDILYRFRNVDSGSISINGKNIKDWNIAALRSSLSYVNQQEFLFDDTILYNLTLGDRSFSKEQVEQVTKAIGFHDFISTLPDGYNTNVGDSGICLSGGQRQMVSIARALLKHPKILILDDSTSACDTHTDALIREALQNNHKEITKFIIAQRVLSIKDCQIIIVLDQGKIIGMGTNDELMNNCPMYKELYESQLGGGDFDEAN